jgi:hypothetical protein
MTGTVETVYSSKSLYDVTLFEGVRVTCRALDMGVDAPYKQKDTVLVSNGQGGAIILGRIPTPVAPSEESAQKDLSQLLAEQAEVIAALASGRPMTLGQPSFQSEREVAVPGDAILKSKTSKARVGVRSDGSFIAATSRILFMALLAAKQAAVITAKRFFLNVIPGFVLKIYTTEKQENPQVGTEARQVDAPVVRVESSLASDPETPAERDFAFEAGGLREMDDLGTGVSSVTTGKKLKRGGRLKVGNFGVLEADHDNKEIRFTLSKEGSSAATPYQFRINDKEMTFSWGSQFMTLRDEGFFVKANVIGLAGPWTMWSPSSVAAFTHKDAPTPTSPPVCEFVATGAGGPGIKFNNNVYFGSGAYFGAKSEPAVLKSFVTEIYGQDLLTALMAHVHGFTPPVGPVLISPDLMGKLGAELGRIATPTYYS